MRRATRGVLAAAVAVTVARILSRPGRPLSRAVVSVGDRIVRPASCGWGRWQGERYRLLGRHPDPAVSDLVLADRVRSSLGVLRKQLDVPRVHVMVNDHVVMLHGDVPGEAEALALEEACAAVAGVAGVESYLHVGLLPSDTRPSEGWGHAAASPARKRLVAAAVAAGLEEAAAGVAVRAVLASFAARLPADEREHLLGHLPSDVRAMLGPPRRHGAPASRVRTTSELVAQVVGAGDDMGLADAERVTAAVLAELCDLVPEEAADIAAVLPVDMRRLWMAASRPGAG